MLETSVFISRLSCNSDVLQVVQEDVCPSTCFDPASVTRISVITWKVSVRCYSRNQQEVQQTSQQNPDVNYFQFSFSVRISLFSPQKLWLVRARDARLSPHTLRAQCTSSLERKANTTGECGTHRCHVAMVPQINMQEALMKHFAHLHSMRLLSSTDRWPTEKKGPS